MQQYLFFSEITATDAVPECICMNILQLNSVILPLDVHWHFAWNGLQITGNDMTGHKRMQ